MQRSCKSIRHQITTGLIHHIKLEPINDKQVKVIYLTNHDSFSCFISLINNPVYHKGSLLLTDNGSSLLNKNQTDDLSSYLTVCNFQLNYQIDYLTKNEIKEKYHINSINDKNKYELFSPTNQKNLPRALDKFLILVSTIRALNKNQYFQ